MARKRKRFRVVAVFDTETTNIIEPGFIEAFPVLYIFNDLRNCNLRTYTPGAHDKIEYFRYEQDAIAYIDNLVEYGRAKGVIPVVCAYNLMFDLHSLLHRLSNAYDLSAIAQSSTNAYAVDLMIDGETVLRFWDTFHLEMNGLAAMGRTAGLEKATGDWDYSLIRTPETPLTDDELFYAGRDTQVIPAYLRYLLDAYEWLEPPMFAHTVLTKTSLVRQLAQNEIGRIKVGDYTLFSLFLMRCKNELPPDYDTYALRKACFRGGFTFTSAMAAGLVVKNTQSWDVTSMHHAYINGRRIPVNWQRADCETLQAACEAIAARPLQAVLRRYDYPFAQHIHACVCFKGLRLRTGSAFEEWQIGLLSKSKFGDREPAAEDFEYDERNKAAGEAVRSRGYRDSAIGAVYAFGKLYSADTAYIFCNEVELWNISRVYEWDSMEAISGEISIKTVVPPDYVTLQSNILFERKSDAKYIDGRYKEGTPYPEDIPDTIPDGIAAGLRAGDISNAFFRAWYQSSVKGAFNGIYGTQAMDVFRPEYLFDETGDMFVNREDLVTPDNFEEKKPTRCKVLYTYGMRIVGGSRMHLIIAIELIYKALPNVLITGGDTDSIKIACPEGVTPDDIKRALEPLEQAVTEAIRVTQRRVRKLYPDKASQLTDIGCFDYEGAAEYHMEAWNKARVYIKDGKPHITCAGLMRPDGAYHIETWMSEMLERIPPEQLLPLTLGYNTTVLHGVSHALEHKRPYPLEQMYLHVTDYLGHTAKVTAHKAVALYPAGRDLGSLAKPANLDNIDYLEKHLGRYVEKRERVITVDENGRAALWIRGADDLERFKL